MSFWPTISLQEPQKRQNFRARPKFLNALYKYCVRPLFLEHQAKIDEALSKTKELGNSLADQVVDEAKDIGGEIKDSDLAKMATEKAAEHVMGEVLANSKQD